MGDFFDRLTTVVMVLNALSGGTFLPVVALLAIVSVSSALVAMWQVRGGRRG